MPVFHWHGYREAPVASLDTWSYSRGTYHVYIYVKILQITIFLAFTKDYDSYDLEKRHGH